MPSLSGTGAMILVIRVVDPATGRSAYGRFRVDTGDDIVLLSPAILSAIGASPVRVSTVQGIDGGPVRVEEYVLDLDLGSIGYLSGITTMGVDLSSLGYDGLLGDNALDHGVLVRDGPGGSWSLSIGSVQQTQPPSLVLPITIGLAGLAAVAIAWHMGRD